MFSILLIYNRLKVISKDKVLWILFLFILVFFGLILSNLVEHIDAGSRMPIVVVDEDQSEMSKDIINNLKEKESLYIVEENYKNAYKLLKDVKVEAIYQFPKGFSSNVKELNIQGSINVYHLEGSAAGKVLSDIVAGEILFDICTIKSVNLLEKAMGLKNSVDIKAIKTMEKEAMVLKNSEELSNIIDVSLNLNENVQSNIDNTLIYKQVIIGLISIFISFFMLFVATSLVKDKELGITERLKTTSTSTFIIYLSNVISLFIVGCIIAGFLSIFIIINFGLFDIDSIISVLLLFGIYVLTLSSFFVLCATIIKKVITFQVVGAMILILFGIIGGSFWNMDFINNPILQISFIVPHHWFVNGFTNMLVYYDFSSVFINYIFPLFCLSTIYFFISYYYNRIKRHIS
ncbi:MAG: ABC transporter permease [Eubacteriales bacterium]